MPFAKNWQRKIILPLIQQVKNELEKVQRLAKTINSRVVTLNGRVVRVKIERDAKLKDHTGEWEINCRYVFEIPQEIEL